MPSAAQEPSISTLASPQAAASRTTIPLVSYVEGNRNRSARVFHALSSPRSYTGPVNITAPFSRLPGVLAIPSSVRSYSVMPQLFTVALSPSASLPEPMNTMRKSVPSSASGFSASSISGSPL